MLLIKIVHPLLQSHYHSIHTVHILLQGDVLRAKALHLLPQGGNGAPVLLRGLQNSWIRIRTRIPEVAHTSDHVRIALLVARGM